MKKNVRRRKKKKNNRYIPILASGLLIALTIVAASWFFSARRTYTVVIMRDGTEQPYAQYHSLAQAKEEMLAQTKRAEKQMEMTLPLSISVTMAARCGFVRPEWMAG